MRKHRIYRFVVGLLRVYYSKDLVAWMALISPLLTLGHGCLDDFSPRCLCAPVLYLPKDPWSSLKMLAHCTSLTRWLGNCLERLGPARGVSRAGLGKRHRSPTRLNRCCALQDHSFRPTAACPLLCSGWSHWGFCSARADSQG